MKWDYKRQMEKERLCVQGYYHAYLKEDGIGGSLEECITQVTASVGKGLRPALLLLCARFGSAFEKEHDHLLKLAALLEMVHMASLVHDDIVDDSPLRRGKPTVQARYGKDMAVYTGDYILSKVMRHMLQEGFYDEGLLLTQCISKMCEGEINQYENQFSAEATVESYYKTIAGKTAAIFATACRMGALRSGCSLHTADLLEKIGFELGIAFQLKDDLKDFLSQEQTEGKPVHADFKSGYYTLPVLHGFAHPVIGKRLRELAKIIPMQAEETLLIEEMNALVCEAGGIDFAKERIRWHMDQLIGLYDQLDDCEAKEMMREFLR